MINFFSKYNTWQTVLHPGTWVTLPVEPLLHENVGKATLPVLQLSEVQHEEITPIGPKYKLEGHVEVAAHV